MKTRIEEESKQKKVKERTHTICYTNQIQSV